MVVSKNNTSLLNAINGQLRSIMRDGTFAALSRKYFDQDIRCK